MKKINIIKIYNANNAAEAEHLIGKSVFCGVGIVDLYYDIQEGKKVIYDGFSNEIMSRYSDADFSFIIKDAKQPGLCNYIAEFEEVEEMEECDNPANYACQFCGKRLINFCVHIMGFCSGRCVANYFGKVEAVNEEVEEDSRVLSIPENFVSMAKKAFEKCENFNPQTCEIPSPLTPKDIFEMGLQVFKTKESLIRYIVCDGEPADESCVGHPVLAKVNFDCDWEECTLLNILNDNFFCRSHEKEDRGWFKYAKKIPGYDYTQTVGEK